MSIRLSQVTRRPLLALIACLAWAGAAPAQTATWTGANSNQFSVPQNWTGDAPVSGSTRDFIFGAPGAANTTTVNTLMNVTANSILFNGNNDYNIQSAAFAYNLGGTITNQGGTNIISAPLVLTGTRTIDVTGGALSLNGVLSGGNGIIKAGGNSLTLNAANTYTGATTLNAGTVSVTSMANGGSNSSIGASTNVAANLAFNGGTLSYSGAGASTDRLFTLRAGGGTIDSSGSGPLTFANTAALVIDNDTDTARALTLGGTNSGNNTFAPVIPDGAGLRTVALAKTGTGSWILTGANTYSGGTTLAGGTLLVNNASGSGTGAGSVSVTSATLGGTGTIAGTVSLNDPSARITAGSGTADPTLTLGNGLSIGASATYGVSLFDTGASDISRIDVTGATTIDSSAGISLNLGALSQAQVNQLRGAVGVGNTRTYTVQSGVGSANFTPANLSFENLGFFESGEWSISATPAAGTVQLIFTPVPEPVTVLGPPLAALGVGVLICRRLRRESPAPAV
jgi:autotransporter-associated beta strand protein